MNPLQPNYFPVIMNDYLVNHWKITQESFLDTHQLVTITDKRTSGLFLHVNTSRYLRRIQCIDFVECQPDGAP